MKIGIIGAGAMGNTVNNYIEERRAQGDDFESLGTAELINGGSIEEAFGETPDIIIDFSNPANIEKTCSYAEEHGIPAVIATTGCGDAETEPDKACRGKSAGCIFCQLFARNHCHGEDRRGNDGYPRRKFRHRNSGETITETSSTLRAVQRCFSRVP